MAARTAAELHKHRVRCGTGKAGDSERIANIRRARQHEVEDALLALIKADEAAPYD